MFTEWHRDQAGRLYLYVICAIDSII
jgi:hypothetical protein